MAAVRTGELYVCTVTYKLQLYNIISHLINDGIVEVPGVCVVGGDVKMAAVECQNCEGTTEAHQSY